MGSVSHKGIHLMKERAEKATEGPWFQADGAYVYANIEVEESDVGWNGDFIGEMNCEEDAEFIAHAREDIPKLMAEIDRLRNGMSIVLEELDYCMAYKHRVSVEEIRYKLRQILYGGVDK